MDIDPILWFIEEASNRFWSMRSFFYIMSSMIGLGRMFKKKLCIYDKSSLEGRISRRNRIYSLVSLARTLFASVKWFGKNTKFSLE